MTSTIHADVPAWPAGSALWVVVISYAIGIVVALPLAVVAAGLVGGEGRGAGAAALLLYATLSGLGSLLVLRYFASQAETLRPAQLGLRLTGLASSAVWFALGAAVVGAFLFFWDQVVDLGNSLAPPEELREPRLGAPLPNYEPLQQFGVAGITSAAGRVVVPAITISVVIQGFVLPALVSWRGPAIAVTICTVLSGGLLGLAGSTGALIVPGLVLGAVMSGLYIATETIYPTIDNEEVALRALGGSPVDGVNLLSRVARDGEVVASAYGEQIDGTAAGLNSPVAGAEGGTENTTSDLLVSYKKDEDGLGFQRRKCE